MIRAIVRRREMKVVAAFVMFDVCFVIGYLLRFNSDLAPVGLLFLCYCQLVGMCMLRFSIPQALLSQVLLSHTADH